MKRRKQSGSPAAHASKGGRVATKRSVPDDIVATLAEQAARTEIREKALVAGQRRRSGNPRSKQPPPSEEMKDVTEIGGLRRKLGQTK